MVQIDIEMPKYCYDCPCHNGENGRCNITGDSIYDKRQFDCPLKEEKSKMDDLISRQVVLSDIGEYMVSAKNAISVRPDDIRNYISGLHHAIQVVTEAPSAQPEPHWIPCSERLPEYMETVLTWDGNCYCVEKRIPYICDDGEHIEGDWWVSDDYNDVESDYYPNLRDGAAVAWMPLPKPYEGEQDDH